jgi:hypothetical protein
VKRILIILACCVAGCESRVTKDAQMDGMLVKDCNGRFWILEHNIGDTYFLKEFKTNNLLH